jgi:hypothetical protein
LEIDAGFVVDLYGNYTDYPQVGKQDGRPLPPALILVLILSLLMVILLRVSLVFIVISFGLAVKFCQRV